MRKSISIVALLLCPLLAWLGWNFWQTRFDVPVAFRGVQNVSTDTAPVDVVLYEYIRGTDTTTGRSIKFRFPRNYYAWEENARGGPQYRIAWGVEAGSFEPLLMLEDRVNKDRASTPDQRKQKIGEIRAKDLSITVYSPTKAIEGVGGAAYGYQTYKDGAESPLGQMCDWMVFLRKGGAVVSPDASPSHLTPEAALQDAKLNLLALLDNGSSIDKLTAAECVAHSPICVVQIPYADCMMSFHVKRQELCQWRTMLERIDLFLAAHIVERTGRRQNQ